MTSLLFLLGVVAFLVVIGWTYANDRGTPEDGLNGLLGMKPPGPDDAGAKKAPHWKASRGELTAAADRAVRRPAPRWRARDPGRPPG